MSSEIAAEAAVSGQALSAQESRDPRGFERGREKPCATEQRAPPTARPPEEGAAAETVTPSLPRRPRVDARVRGHCNPGRRRVTSRLQRASSPEPERPATQPRGNERPPAPGRKTCLTVRELALDSREMCLLRQNPIFKLNELFRPA